MKGKLEYKSRRIKYEVKLVRCSSGSWYLEVFTRFGEKRLFPLRLEIDGFSVYDIISHKYESSDEFLQHIKELFKDEIIHMAEKVIKETIDNNIKETSMRNERCKLLMDINSKIKIIER